jgi:hypothetical protein
MTEKFIDSKIHTIKLVSEEVRNEAYYKLKEVILERI